MNIKQKVSTISTLANFIISITSVQSPIYIWKKKWQCDEDPV